MPYLTKFMQISQIFLSEIIDYYHHYFFKNIVTMQSNYC